MALKPPTPTKAAQALHIATQANQGAFTDSAAATAGVAAAMPSVNGGWIGGTKKTTPSTQMLPGDKFASEVVNQGATGSAGGTTGGNINPDGSTSGSTNPLAPGMDLVSSQQKMAGDLFKDVTGKPTNTLEEQVKAQAAERQRQTEFAISQSGIQNQIQTTQTQQQVENLQSQQAATAANLAMGRENVQSMGNPMAVIQAGQRTQQNIGIAQQTLQLAQAQRDDLIKRARIAESTGNYDAAKALRSESLAASYMAMQMENEQKRIDIEAYTAVNTQQRNNWGSFTSMIDSGVTVPPEAFAGLAQTMNLPASSVGAMLQYQMGAAAITANKQLDPQVKEAQLGQLKQNLFDQVSGYNSPEAGNARHYDYLFTNMGKAAADQFAKGLTTPLNPLYSTKLKAETELTSAQSDLAKSQTPMNWIKVNAARQTLGGYGGQSDVVLPGIPNEKYQITPSEDGLSVSVGVQTGTVLGSGTGKGQCAAAVNIVTGTKFPDKYNEKLSYAQRNLANISPQDVTPGAIFLYSIGQYGHTGIVESMNPDGSFNIFDQNGDGNGAKTGSQHRSVTLPQDTSFWQPPNAQSPSQYTGKTAAYNSNATVYGGQPLSMYTRQDPFGSKPYVVEDPNQWKGDGIEGVPNSSEVQRLRAIAGANGLKTLSPEQGASMAAIEYSKKSTDDMRSWLEGLNSKSAVTRLGNIANLKLNRIFQFDPAPLVFDAFNTQSISAAKDAAGGRVNTQELQAVQGSWPLATDTVSVAKQKLDKIEKDMKNRHDTIWGVSTAPLTKPGQAPATPAVKYGTVIKPNNIPPVTHKAHSFIE